MGNLDLGGQGGQGEWRGEALGQEQVKEAEDPERENRERQEL